MEGLGELFFGCLQLLLGFLELGDVPHHDHQRRCHVEVERFGGDQAGKHLAVAAAKGHFQVADAAGLQALQQARPDTGNPPDVQVGGGLANDVLGLEADLLLERFVDLQQATVAQARDHQNVRALLEHGGKFLFRQAQCFFSALGVGDIDHQAAQHRLMPVLDQADDISHPQAAAVGGDHPVIEAVIAPGQYFVIAEGLGAGQVGGVNDVAPEARNQPMGQGITEKVFGVGRYIAVGEVRDFCFPGDCRQALHQAAVVVFAAAQFLFKVDPAGDFRAQAAVDADNHRQHGSQQQQSGQAVHQQVTPESSMIEDVTDPMLLNGADFSRAHVRQDFVENADQHLVVAGYTHGQLIAIGRFTADIQPIELELAQAPDAGSQIAYHCVYFVDGQRLQRRTDVGHRHKVQVRMVGAQQFVGGVVFHHGDFQAVQVFQVMWLRTPDMGQDDNRKIQIGAGERQVILAFRGRHDARQQVQLALLGLFQDGGPAHRLDGREPGCQPFADDLNVIRGKALVAALIVTKLEGRP
ncbi:hypothetical protein D3C80_838200 [compost metagenome]